MAEESPAFQWYPGDYLSDGKVQLLTSAQEGIYTRLWNYCWKELSIPADPKIARQLCKADASLEDVEHVLETFFIPSKDDGRLIHKRLEDERKKQKKNRKARSEAGRKSGDSRRLKSEQNSNKCSTNEETNVPTKTNSSSSTSSSTSSSVGNTNCVEPPSGPTPTIPGDDSGIVVMTFPVVGKPFTWDLTRGKVREFRKTFPALDVVGECRLALQWCKENRAKQKTFRGMGAFLLSWLARSQNSGRGRDSGGTRATPGNADPRGNNAARDEFLRQNGINPDAESGDDSADDPEDDRGDRGAA